MTAAPLAIAPIGTCRIHTPLRKGVARYPVKLQLARNYGFVHTSSEALQQLRYMRCDLAIPADVQTLTFRPGSRSDAPERPHAPADLYVVEVSSKKLLTVDGHPIQINYMTRYFGDFFADRQRARTFWSMSSASRLAERRTWLDGDSVFKRLAPTDRDLLARILMHEQSNDELERDLQEIADLVGKDKLVFVTHVDATTPDNMVIEQRHQLIESVRAIAQRMGVPCYNPTLLMLEVGQINALENGGLDLTHYTDQFAERLFADWYASLFEPRMGTTRAVAGAAVEPAPDVPVDEAASIESAWNAGELREASQRVRAVLRAHPRRLDHRMLLARMQWELGDFEGVIRSLDSVHGDSGLNEQAEQLLMRAHFRLGRYGEAKRVAAALLGDEIETPEILRICAESATRVGDSETALANWKRLFRISDDARGAAAAVLDLLKSAGDVDGAARWGDEVRETLPTHAPSFVAQWEGKLHAQDRGGLMALAEDPIRLEEAVAFELVQRASAEGFAVAAATLAVAQGLPGSQEARASEFLAHRAAQWLDEGLAALESADLLVAADRIQAIARIAPEAATTVRAKRALERRLRQDARLALAAKSYPVVVAVVDIALSTRTTFPELDTFLGRAADALGDTPTALRHLRRAADEPGAPVSARMHLGRVAVRGERYLEAIDAYRQVTVNEAAEPAVREEALRQLTVLRSRSIRAAREMLAREEYDDAWSLLDILEAASPQGADVGQEKRRVLASLHSKLRTLDAGNAGERMKIGETILRFVPNDAVGLKVAATGAMRMHRFVQALPYWYALRDISDNVEQVESNVRKCLMWIDRTKNAEKTAPAAFTQAA
jgi:tetratricopeptide (TPR) repeat protein